MDDSVFNFIKEWIWGPSLAALAWAWNRNEKEHDSMRATAQRLENTVLSSGSTTNDRMVIYVDDRLKEQKEFVMAEDHKLQAEMLLQRGNTAKLFDKLEDHARRSEDRHRELLEKFGDGILEIHRALAGKVDK